MFPALPTSAARPPVAPPVAGKLSFAQVAHRGHEILVAEAAVAAEREKQRRAHETREANMTALHHAIRYGTPLDSREEDYSSYAESHSGGYQSNQYCTNEEEEEEERGEEGYEEDEDDGY